MSSRRSFRFTADGPLPIMHAPTHALVVVDLQNDFLHGGMLAVPGGDEVVDVINHAQERFDLIVATQDWHPRNHVSFAANHPGQKPGDVIEVDGLLQILWPVHCVEHTRSAALCDRFDASRLARVFYKGVEPRVDSYSAFFDNAERRSTGLGDYLRQAGARELFLAGLATDYCVSYRAEMRSGWASMYSLSWTAVGASTRGRETRRPRSRICGVAAST